MSAEGFPWGRVRDAQRFLFAVKPWWYRFMRQMEIVPIDIPPQPDGSYSGLTATDKSMNLYIDKTFAIEAPLEKIAGALEKELQHHVRDSWRRMSNLPPELREKYLNICMDLEINSSMRAEVSQLTADGDKMTQWRLLKICEKSQTFTVDDLDKYAVKGPPDITDESWLPEALGLPDGLSAEKYYHLIRDEFDRDQPDDENDSQDDDDESPGDDLLDGHGVPDQSSDDDDDQEADDAAEPGDDPAEQPEGDDQESGQSGDSSDDSDPDGDSDEDDDFTLEDLMGEDSDDDSDAEPGQDQDGANPDGGEPSDGDPSQDADSDQQDGDGESGEPQDGESDSDDDSGDPSSEGGEPNEDGSPQDDDQQGSESSPQEGDPQEGDPSPQDQQSGAPGEGSDSAGQSQSSSGAAEGDPPQDDSDHSGDGPSSDPLNGDPRSREEIIEDLIAGSPSLEWWAKEISPDDDKPSWMPEPTWEEAVGDDQQQADAASERDDALSELADDIEEMSRSRSIVSGFGISPEGAVKDWSTMVITRSGTDWRSRLSKLISASYLSAQIKGSSDLTYAVRNPNQAPLGPVLMGLQGYAPKVMVLQDVSGSMDRFMDRALSSFKDIVSASASNGAEPVVWITADTQVMDVGSTVNLTSDDIKKMNRGFGGTVLDDIMVELAAGKFVWKGKRYPKPDLLIVSTDCMFKWPWKESRIIPGGHTKVLVASVKEYDSVDRFLPRWVNPTSNFVYIE